MTVSGASIPGAASAQQTPHPSNDQQARSPSDGYYMTIAETISVSKWGETRRGGSGLFFPSRPACLTLAGIHSLSPCLNAIVRNGAKRPYRPWPHEKSLGNTA